MDVSTATATGGWGVNYTVCQKNALVKRGKR
jgi:hypothetical protein